MPSTVTVTNADGSLSYYTNYGAAVASSLTTWQKLRSIVITGSVVVLIAVVVYIAFTVFMAIRAVVMDTINSSDRVRVSKDGIILKVSDEHKGQRVINKSSKLFNDRVAARHRRHS